MGDQADHGELSFSQRHPRIMGFLRTIAVGPLVISAITYMVTLPEREKQADYAAWQVIDGASPEQHASGGRIQALEALNEAKWCVHWCIHPRVSLAGLTIENANLPGLSLKDANLAGADLQGSDLMNGNFQGANLRGAFLVGAKLYGVDMRDVDLQGADLRGAKDLTVEQVKTTRNWESATFDGEMRSKLGLP